MRLLARGKHEGEPLGVVLVDSDGVTLGVEVAFTLDVTLALTL